MGRFFTSPKLISPIERKGGSDEGGELVYRENVRVMNGYMSGVGVGGWLNGRWAIGRVE